ncbi:hypothetical protein LALCM10_160081 [Dellaglioa algida]|nr:hypothetical protein LALCM10_160081 [Dellaglioa algida]
MLIALTYGGTLIDEMSVTDSIRHDLLMEMCKCLYLWVFFYGKGGGLM